jgi:hypothetical protein
MFSYFLGGPVQFLAMYVSVRGPTRKVSPPPLWVDRQVPTNSFSRPLSPQEASAIVKINRNACPVLMAFFLAAAREAAVARRVPVFPVYGLSSSGLTS